MADYTAVDNATIEPNAPLISATLFALRDNPAAIAEGAAGAPRIQDNAYGDNTIAQGKLKNSVAGDTIVCRLSVAEAIYKGNNYGNFNDRDAGTLSATILVGGTIRVTLEQTSAGTGGSDGSAVRVLVNSNEQVEWLHTVGDAKIDRSIDLNVSRGDKIIIQHKYRASAVTGSSRISNAFVRASSNSPVVAA